MAAMTDRVRSAPGAAAIPFPAVPSLTEPEPNFCQRCGLIIEPPLRRCNWCIAERSGNLAALVDRARGLAVDGPFKNRPRVGLVVDNTDRLGRKAASPMTS